MVYNNMVYNNMVYNINIFYYFIKYTGIQGFRWKNRYRHHVIIIKSRVVILYTTVAVVHDV